MPSSQPQLLAVLQLLVMTLHPEAAAGWTSYASLPSALGEVSACFNPNLNTILLVGQGNSRTFTFNTATGDWGSSASWEAGPARPYAGNHHAAVFRPGDGKCYLVGGLDSGQGLVGYLLFGFWVCVFFICLFFVCFCELRVQYLFLLNVLSVSTSFLFQNQQAHLSRDFIQRLFVSQCLLFSSSHFLVTTIRLTSVTWCRHFVRKCQNKLQSR